MFVCLCRPVCIDIFISIPYTGIRALSQPTAFPFKRHILQVLGTWTRGLAAPGESQQWDMATCQGCFGEGLLEFALFPSQAPHMSVPCTRIEPRVSSDPRHPIQDPSPKVTHSFSEPRAEDVSAGNSRASASLAIEPREGASRDLCVLSAGACVCWKPSLLCCACCEWQELCWGADGVCALSPQCWRAAAPRPPPSTKCPSTPGGSASPSSPTGASRPSATSPRPWHLGPPQVSTLGGSVLGSVSVWHHIGNEGVYLLRAWGLLPVLCPGTLRDLAATATAADVLLLVISCGSDDGLSPGCHHGGPRRVLLLGWHQAEEIPRHGLPRCHGQELGQPESVFQVRDGALGQHIKLLGFLCFTNTFDLCFHAVRQTKLKWPRASPVQCKTRALSINSFHT